MPSDGAGGRSGGDGGRGSGGGGGRGGGSDGNNGQGVGGHRGGGRGDGNNANGPGNSADGGRGNGSEGSNVSGSREMNSGRGQGGFGGLGIGNPKSYGASANPTGYEKSVDIESQRSGLNSLGDAARVASVFTNPVLGALGWGLKGIAKYGRVEGELTDAERAFRENEMGDPQRGGGGDRMLGFPQGMNATYQIPKSAYDALVKAAQNDAATNAFLQTLNSAKAKSLVGSELIDRHNSNVDKMNARSARVFGENKYTPQLHAKSTQTNPQPKQYGLVDSVSQRALNEIEEAKRSGAKFVIR